MIHARLSRRGLFGLAAGGAGSLAAAALLGQRACRMATVRRPDAASRASAVDYIDRDGWMLTAADGQTLGGHPTAARP